MSMCGKRLAASCWLSFIGRKTLKNKKIKLTRQISEDPNQTAGAATVFHKIR